MQNTQDTNSYAATYQKIEHMRAAGSLTDQDSFPPMNQEWVDQMQHRAGIRVDNLNAEFRRQKDDGVKESIRRAMDDVFQQYLAMGNINVSACLR